MSLNLFRTASVVTVSTTEEQYEAVSTTSDWHVPALRPRRMQVSSPLPPPLHPLHALQPIPLQPVPLQPVPLQPLPLPPPPPVAVELEVATTDMWCHT